MILEHHFSQNQIKLNPVVLKQMVDAGSKAEKVQLHLEHPVTSDDEEAAKRRLLFGS